MYSNRESEFENVASNNPFALASPDCCATIRPQMLPSRKQAGVGEPFVKAEVGDQ
jgi:hypothetical protein